MHHCRNDYEKVKAKVMMHFHIVCLHLFSQILSWNSHRKMTSNILHKNIQICNLFCRLFLPTLVITTDEPGVETVTDFIFLGSKITMGGDCSHNIKRCLLLGRKAIKKPAAAAKSLQSCLTLCDPIDGSPPGSPIPGILQARVLEWVAISFSNA